MDIINPLLSHQDSEYAKIPATPETFRVDNPRRPLGCIEVYFCNMRGIIGSLGLCEYLDFKRAEKVVNFLQHVYPFFSSAVVFDEELKWLRYEPQEIRQYTFDTDNLKCLKALQEYSDYVASTMQMISSKHMTHFEILEIEMPELPQVKYAIALNIHHCMIDGSSLTRFFRYFNQIYVDEGFDFAAKPKHLQVASFRPMCAWPKYKPYPVLEIKPIPAAISPLTGSGNFDVQNITEPTDYPRLCSMEDGSRFFKMQGINYSLSMVAFSLALQASYGIWHKDIADEFQLLTSDVRIHDDMFERMNPDLDFKNLILGFSATNNLLSVKGNPETTVFDLAKQLQQQFNERQNKTDLENIQELLTSDLAPMRTKPASRSALTLSNVGRTDCGQGPVRCFLGGTTTPNIAMMRIGAAGLMTSEYGTFVTMPITRSFSDTENVRLRDKWFQIQKLCRERGPQNVTMSDLVKELYDDLFDKI